jgi:hypothetical protein
VNFQVFSPDKHDPPFTGTASSLLRLLPPVLRARDFHLYTGKRREEGGRLVDLWQGGGAAILGHKPPAVFREFKNAASRGLWNALPHPLEKRLYKALGRLFPGRSFHVYGPGIQLPDFPEGDFSLWRPFLDEKAPLAAPEEIPVLCPLIPGLGRVHGRISGPLILAVDPQFEKSHPLPPPELIAPALSAALARGIYSLIAAGPERGKCPFPEIRAILPKSPWERRGVYLFPREAPRPGAWEGLFRRFLSGGFLVPPAPEDPLILPGFLSPGEEAKLAGLLLEQGEFQAYFPKT